MLNTNLCFINGVLSDVIPDFDFSIIRKMLDWNEPEHDSMDGSKSPNDAGTIEYGGTDNGGEGGSERDVYSVFWDSSESTTNALGTSAMFEESQHLKDGLDGKFNIKSGCAGFGIMNEVEAKQWVVDNISGIKDKYVDKNDNHLEKQTHYSRIKSNSGNHAKILKELRGGATGIGRSKNEIQGRNYSIFGFGGYK